MLWWKVWGFEWKGQGGLKLVAATVRISDGRLRDYLGLRLLCGSRILCGGEAILPLWIQAGSF